MKNIPSSPKDHTDSHETSDNHQEVAPPYPHEMNIADGGEFLDDGIRSKEQPYNKTTTGEPDAPSADNQSSF